MEFNLQGATVTVGATNGLFAGNTYEVEVYVQDSFGAVSEARTLLTGMEEGAGWPHASSTKNISAPLCSANLHPSPPCTH